MKETTFIRQNIDRWKIQEWLVDNASDQSADDLADAYVSLTADLAFAQTHYPESRITLYLNNLASALHVKIYARKSERWHRLRTFWAREVPLALWDGRRLLLLSAAVVVVSALMGVVSTLGDETFPRVILGDYYVDMTLENIANGDPMAVYKGDSSTPMFLQITLNNIWVSFLCFASGIFTSLATGYLLFQNGIMIGAFQTFFYQHGFLWESTLAIWLHGTVEISSIIVAGAAGLSLGNGWLFPGTYRRLDAFRRGARRGMIIVVGTVPLFIFAAFIEGFFTRYTDVSDLLRVLFILAELAFVVFYFVWLPYRLGHGTEFREQSSPPKEEDVNETLQ